MRVPLATAYGNSRAISSRVSGRFLRQPYACFVPTLVMIIQGYRYLGNRNRSQGKGKPRYSGEVSRPCPQSGGGVSHRGSPDHLVGPLEKGWGNGEAEDFLPFVNLNLSNFYPLYMTGSRRYRAIS